MPEPVPVLCGATVEEMETKQILLHTLKETESTAGLPRTWGPEKRDEEARDEVVKRWFEHDLSSIIMTVWVVSLCSHPDGRLAVMKLMFTDETQRHLRFTQMNR